jgi:hypothetical protein
MGRGGKAAYQIGRGLLDRDTARYDSLTRKSGYLMAQGLRRLVPASWRAAGRMR